MNEILLIILNKLKTLPTIKRLILNVELHTFSFDFKNKFKFRTGLTNETNYLKFENKQLILEYSSKLHLDEEYSKSQNCMKSKKNIVFLWEKPPFRFNKTETRNWKTPSNAHILFLKLKQKSHFFFNSNNRKT